VTSIPVHPVGALIGIVIVAVVIATFYWMLHPPASRADVVAEQAEQALEEMVGSIIVVFAEEIHSEHMMVLGRATGSPRTRGAVAVYLVEVPLILPQNAQMPDEDRRGYELWRRGGDRAAQRGQHPTELMHTRQIGPP